MPQSERLPRHNRDRHAPLRRISLADYVQAGRYAAGLDPVVTAGGPTAPSQLRIDDCGLRIGEVCAGSSFGNSTIPQLAFSMSRKPQASKVGLIQDALSVDGSLMVEMAAEYVITNGTSTARAAIITSADDLNRDEVIGGTFATAYGNGLAVKSALADLSALPTELAGTRITVRDSAGVERLAKLRFVSPSQVSFQISADCAPGFATVRILTRDGTTSLGTLWIGSASRSPY